MFLYIYVEVFRGRPVLEPNEIPIHVRGVASPDWSFCGHGGTRFR
jgi:hypothetical protein